MRTVLVHLRNTTEEQVVNFLKRTYTYQAGPPWICDVGGDACLYINIYRDMELESEPESIANLCNELRCRPTVSISADVSGRHPGDEQVREFVSILLSQFEGLAQDEFTEGFWTLDEIRSECRKPTASGLSGRQEGHSFFDYRDAWKPKP